MYEKDTIVSISTGIGEGAIGIVRMSGDAATGLAGNIFIPSGSTNQQENFKLRHGFIVEPGTGERVDEVLMAVMHAPNTYTREDVVEINCHGGYRAQMKVLDLLVDSGARLAEPGEFTRRAFLNGRIDLLEAEAVLGLVKARSDEALKAAARQCSGKASGELGSLREEVITILSTIEANLDFIEEDLQELDRNAIERYVSSLKARLGEFLRWEQAGDLMRNGIEVVIVGKPNVGKSSLLNALLREERALVTEIPGTTRDAVEGGITVSGIPFLLVDTAGIHKAGDRVEILGVEKSKIKLKNAQIALVVLDSSQQIEEKDRHILELTANKRRVIIGSKADLPRHPDFQKCTLESDRLIFTSSLTSEGIKELETLMTELALGDSSLTSGDAMLMSARQRTHLRKAYQDIKEALSLIKKKEGEEIVALALREALINLDTVTGRHHHEDVLDAIFTRFCVGK